MARSGLPFSRGHKILFDGDSLTSRRRPPSLDTWPYLELMNWRATYADEMARILFCLRPDLDLSFFNAAVGGSTCRSLAERFDGLVLPHRPDWVFLTLGGNDSRVGVPLAEFRETMTRYSARVRDECGGRVAFVGGFPVCPRMPEEKAGTYPKRAPYYRALRDVARRTGGLYVDVGKGLERKARALFRQSQEHTVYSDGGHFNAVGGLIIAGEILRALGFEW